jgi:hypothetical protein
MALDNSDQKTSLKITGQFPEVYREDAPLLVEFVKNYYQWTEQPGNIEYASKTLKSIRDIQFTSNTYNAYHQKEFSQSLGTPIVADSELVIKNILGFYRARGSQESFEYLFRTVYGANVEIFYPWENVLIASGSKWNKNQYFRATPVTGSPYNIIGENILGTLSGATAVVDNVLLENISGIDYYKIILSDVIGAFEEGENVETTSGSGSSIVILVHAPVDNASIDTDDVPSSGGGGGVDHQVNDLVRIDPAGGGGGAFAKVTSINSNSAVELYVRYGGKGYRVNQTVITIPGGSGSSANAVVSTLSNTEVITLSSYIRGANTIVLSHSFWGNTAAYANTPFSLTTNINSTIASSSSANATVGSIATLRMVNYGVGYLTLPIGNHIVAKDQHIFNTFVLPDPVRPTSRYGNSALLGIRSRNGYIKTVSISNTGIGYFTGDTITLKNLSRTAVNAHGIFYANTYALVEDDGHYSTTYGHLSSDKALQDNDYYQKMSYEIRSSLSRSNYIDIVKKLIHPAGRKLFNRVQLINDVDSSPGVDFSIDFNVSGIGNVMIPGNNSVGYWVGNSMYQVSDLDLVTVSEWSSNSVVIGRDFLAPTGLPNSEDTSFESSITGAGVSRIKIIPTSSPSSNATLVVKTISSNAIIVLVSNFPGGRVANATYNIYNN